jgi:hypothetical protein
MPMKLPDWRVWTVLAVALLILMVGTSQQFQTCMGEATNYYVTFRRCLGDYIIAKNAIVIALATLATAYFTGTIWSINRSQLGHARQVERAYISGGGGYRTDTDDDGVPHMDTTQFVLTVQNYGKTPGTVTAYAVFVVERENLPLQPVYLNPGFVPTPFYGTYQPGGPTLPIVHQMVPHPLGLSRHINPIAYGRLWYTDIFGGQHHFSFALPIRNPAYTEST